METLIICLVPFTVALIMTTHHFKNTTANKSKRENRNNWNQFNVTDANHRNSNASEERPYFKKYFHNNNNHNDFLDFSGGMLGI
jgi:hypothetical protein